VQTFSWSHGLACNHDHDYDHLLVHNEQDDDKMATTTRPPATHFPDILLKTNNKQKRNGLSPLPAPLLPSSAMPKLEPPTCLYCTDIRIIISFLAIRID